MKLINGARRSGKTRALLEYCNNNRRRVIVCPNELIRRVLLEKAEELRITLIKPLTIIEYKQLVLDNPNPIFLCEVGDNQVTPLALTSMATPEMYEGTFCFEELDECLNMLGIRVSVATGTIPTIHPQTYILSKSVPEIDKEHELGVWDLCQK